MPAETSSGQRPCGLGSLPTISRTARNVTHASPGPEQLDSKLYGKQVIEHHTGQKYPFSHSVAKTQLFGEDK